jgi:beta-glucosidase
MSATKSARFPVPVVNYGFPQGFKFGASTAAYQIEGGWNADGKGKSIWDVFSHIPGNMHNNDTGDVACDHYNRMPQDVALMKRLGLDAYRFSASWSRVLPEGRGKVNEAGLDFYDRLVDRLLKAGIDPFITLYHWDLPHALQEKRWGWLNPDTGHHFADYSTLMVKRLGDRIKHWATFNEPEVIVAGYIGKGLAPGYDDPSLGYQAGHGLMVAHGRAIQAMRAARSGLQSGIVLNFVPIYPSDDTEEARAQARRRWTLSYGWFLDALLKGAYPNDLVDHCADKGFPFGVEPGQPALIAQKLDFLGINFYTRFMVNGKGESIPPAPGAPITQMGWEIYPKSFTDMLVEMHKEYELPPVYITENGAALDDIVRKSRVRDEHRMRYLHEHIAAVRAAAAAGVDVRGYFVWSLMDNLEWSLGYSKTFGLIHVDRQTMRRRLKDSGKWYREMIGVNRR